MTITTKIHRALRLSVAVACLTAGLATAAPALAANTVPALPLELNQRWTFTLPGTTCSVTYVYGNYAGRGYSSIRMNSGNCTRVTTRATNANSNGYYSDDAATSSFGQFAQATPSAGTIINADFCVVADNGGVRSRFAYNAFTKRFGTTTGPLGACG